jgi:hypothetical protein
MPILLVDMAQNVRTGICYKVVEQQCKAAMRPSPIRTVQQRRHCVVVRVEAGARARAADLVAIGGIVIFMQPCIISTDNP